MKFTFNLLRNATFIPTEAQRLARAASQLPSYLSQVLIGQVLGDANLSRNSAKANVRITWSFGFPFEDYANYVHSVFSSFCNTGVYAAKTGLRLKTVTSPLFTQYFDMFYKFNDVTGKYVKVVPVAIMELMTPVVLAHLIMGDGNFDQGRNRIRIYTNSFTYEDNVRLAAAISNMGILTNVMTDKVGTNGQQYILTIGGMQHVKLREMVLPHMHVSMHYRVGIKS